MNYQDNKQLALVNNRDWTSFTQHPLAHEIASGLEAIPKQWALTPVKLKQPYRKNWQAEETVSREMIRKAILHGERLTNKWGRDYTAYSSGYGLRLGDVSGGLLAIDVDGPSAEPLLESLAGGKENIPNTVSWTSGKSGRRQILFQVPDEYRDRLKNFNREVIEDHVEVCADKDEQLELRYNKSQSILPPICTPRN